ncbi:hypothetical protein L2E82_13908 [Cichorium intybus]|uniref:Uncharacterized protein n=1 Tax=Cichorium intybus TaxID=13427 RepID=A0ACB9EZ50_CICIN|nr:hypothetical protein L2E82_13908 [Cichorium intybus]
MSVSCLLRRSQSLPSHQPTPATTFHSYSDDAQPRAAASGQISLSTATHSRLSPSSAHTTAASYRTPPPASAALCSLFLLSGDAHLRLDLTLDSLHLRRTPPSPPYRTTSPADRLSFRLCTAEISSGHNQKQLRLPLLLSVSLFFSGSINCV